MSLPSITVAIPTYARVKWLEQAVFSALAQEYDGKLRVLVFNDCPRQQLTIDDPRVRIENVPQSFTTLGGKRNAMLDAVDTEWVALLDDDDFLLPWHCQTRVTYGRLATDPITLSLMTWYFQAPMLAAMAGIPVDLVAATALVRGRYHSVDVGEDRRLIDALWRQYRPIFVCPVEAKPSYVYCWGNGTYHISGQGENSTSGTRFRLDADRRMLDGTEPTGRIELRPRQGFDPRWVIEAMQKPYPHKYEVPR